MSAFDWIGNFMDRILQFIPEWDLLEPTQGGVRFRPGGKVDVLTPGKMYWWWPVCMKVTVMDTKRQTITLSLRLTTKCGESVLIEVVIAYTIGDVELAIVQTRDFDDTIDEIGMKIVVKPVMSRRFEEVITDLADSNKMNNEIKSAARSVLRDYGIEVVDGFVVTFVKTKVYCHDGVAITLGEGEEE